MAASPVGEAAEGEVLRPGEVRYADEAARNTALVTAYEKVVSEQPDSVAAAWARLALGRFKLDAGEFADARALFEAALEGAEGGDLTLRAAAIEGVGFSHEGEEHWDDAATAYERLDGLGGAYEQVAALHQARILLAKGERATAIERLQALIEALRAEDAPELTYVRDQAELTLMSLDASLVQRTAAPAGLDLAPKVAWDTPIASLAGLTGPAAAQAPAPAPDGVVARHCASAAACAARAASPRGGFSRGRRGRGRRVRARGRRGGGARRCGAGPGGARGSGG